MRSADLSDTFGNENWYLAEIIELITVEGDPQNVVHINLILLRARSPDEAFEKAVAVGQAGESTYQNTDGRTVTVAFRGLRDLLAIQADLEDGAELAYEELIGISSEQIDKLAKPRNALALFSAASRVSGPNYMDRDIVAEAKQRFGVDLQLPDD
jgi:hypothetical protein